MGLASLGVAPRLESRDFWLTAPKAVGSSLSLASRHSSSSCLGLG